MKGRVEYVESAAAYMDWRRRNRTSVTWKGDSHEETRRKTLRPETCYCCRKSIDAASSKKVWHASYRFRTCGGGEKMKTVRLWYHCECCPDVDPLTDEIALEVYYRLQEQADSDAALRGLVGSRAAAQPGGSHSTSAAGSFVGYSIRRNSE